MKKNVTLKDLGRVATAIFSVMLVLTGSISAENISKSFEFGPATSQSRSHLRTFPVPCRTIGGVAAVVKFQRLGPDGAGSDLPIIVELREPDSASNQEGPIADSKSVTAKKTEQTVILRSGSSNRGCSLPWRVRVRYALEGTPSAQAFGTIRLDFDERARYLDSPYPGRIARNGSKTVNLGGPDGLSQGKIEITGGWVHYIGANAIKLRIELVDPNGAVIRTAEGYANRDAERILNLPILKLTYQVARYVSGQWKLKLTNLDPDDETNVYQLDNKFTPGCP